MTKDNRPNVLFISVDDLNSYVEILGGHPNASTSNMKKLASRGVVFTNAHASATHCHPSRASALTGFTANALHIFSNKGPMLREVYPSIVTLPQYFKNNGYLTEQGGKIFHGKDRDPISWHESFFPKNHDEIDQDLSEGPEQLLRWAQFNQSRTRYLQHDDQVIEWYENRLRNYTQTDYLKSPFFLAVGFTSTHLPWIIPKSDLRHFKPVDSLSLPPGYRPGDLDDLPHEAPIESHRLSWLNKTNTWKTAIQYYLAAVRRVDNMIGRVLSSLQATPFADNTIVILWSDHGFHLGEKGHIMKDTLWEMTSRIPLVIAGPGISKGKKVKELVGLIDIFPTLVELCKLPVREGLEGVSLVPFLEKRDNQFRRDEKGILISKAHTKHALRTDGWKYIVYGDGSEEVYKIKKDPHEWYNLANVSRFGDQKISLRRELVAQASKRLEKSSLKVVPRILKSKWSKLPPLTK